MIEASSSGRFSRALEVLMNEFFAISTSNQRKKDIEELLNNFSSQQGAWHQCFYFLGHTRNEYVLMYTLSVFENLINRQWVGLRPAEKLEIRNVLTKFLLTNHKSMQLSIRNKLIKVLVCIGKLDWPHFYPDFFNNIIQLIQQQGTTSMGLQMLLTTSEELVSPREDLSADRKEQLRKLLEEQIPSIFGIITHVLIEIKPRVAYPKDIKQPYSGNYIRQTSAVSDDFHSPPSPTHGDNDDGSPSHVAYGSSPLQSGSHLIRTMFKTPPSNKQNLQPLPPLDHESELLTSLCLNCLTHFFSWMPLSAHISSNLLTVIFHLANFGCDIHSVHQATSPSKANSSFSTSGSSSIGVLAMNCINEIVGKNCVPVDFEEFLLKMFQQTFQLLQKLTKDTTSQSVGNQLTELDSSYVEKFTDFLRLFVDVHLKRFESNAHFPVVEFLALLYKYTFKQPSEEGFFNCLDIWSVFLDYLQDKFQASRLQEGNHLIDRYRDALVSVMSELLRKMQFGFNQTQLEELDDELLDDDEETEWQHFLRQCLEIIAKIAELLPTEAFGILYPAFQENLEVYLGLGQFVIDSSEGRKLTIVAENECRKLHCTLRDLSTLLQAMGRLSDHFISEKFASRFENGLSLVEKFCQAAVYGSSSKLFLVKTAVPTVLQPDLAEVHAHTLAAVQAYSHWLAQFYGETQRQPTNQEKFVPLLRSIIEAIEPLLGKEVPAKVVQAAVHLFLSISTTVRPSFWWSCSGAEDVMTSAEDQ
ncbi:putative exportin-6 [Apostichopus japonicus]|uniref:Putative exportin-6 n=1 Tax=Stichopus japonicus TaxID=307972 RepID=A0A2G8JWD8_STIJA|nr:putative exportin-6 [Apostichopus japonicus]